MKKFTKFLSSPEGVFLLLATLFGVIFAIFIPYGAGFDEEQHVIRIYDLAAAKWLPNQRDPGNDSFFTPVDFVRYAYQRRFFQTPAQDLLEGSAFHEPLNRNNLLGTLTRSIYSPFNFLPQAATARFFWRKYDYPVVPVAILCRIAGLAMYIGLSFLAVRLLPVGKWTLAVLALAPSALYQAATLNADGFTNGVSFLFAAVVLHLALDEQSVFARWKVVLLMVSILLVGAAKPGMFVLFPLLFLLTVRRFPSKGWALATGIAVVVAIVFAVQYNAQAAQTSHFAGADEGSLSQQIALIQAHPWDFLYTLIWGNLRAIGNYFMEWVAVYGHWVGAVPAPVYILYVAALIFALGAETLPTRLTPYQRWVLGGTFLISSSAFALLYTINNYVPGSLAGFGHQGRYYIPTAPLLYLALSGLFSFHNFVQKKLPLFLTGSITLSLAFYLLGIYATYYTYCGTSWYTFQGCTQPVYKNIEWAQTPALEFSSSTPLRQEFPNRCGELEQIQIYIHAKTSEPDTTLVFTLKDSADHILAQEGIPANALPAKRFFVWRIPEEVQTKTASALEIRATGKGVVELALNGGDYFREAHLIVGNQEIADDLVFRYVCAPFWKQIIQDVISIEANN